VIDALLSFPPPHPDPLPPRGEREIFRKMFFVYCFLFLEKSIIRHMVYKDVILED